MISLCTSSDKTEEGLDDRPKVIVARALMVAAGTGVDSRRSEFEVLHGRVLLWVWVGMAVEDTVEDWRRQ